MTQDMKPFLEVFRKFQEVWEQIRCSLYLCTYFIIYRILNYQVLSTDHRMYWPFDTSFPQTRHTSDRTLRFKKAVREATSFTDMAAYLEERITWCKSQQRKKEKRLLTFLRLKCHRMSCLEAAGYKWEQHHTTWGCWGRSTMTRLEY